MKRQRKVIPFEIKEINEEERSFLAVASTEDLDRDNDRIISTGWDMANFKKNPVIPWSHRYSDPPVAQAADIYVADGQLMFRPKFATKEEYAFADTIYNLYKGGYLRAFSVGFDPKRYEIVDRDKGRRGYDFLEQELWEISACTVPSNPNALIAAKAKGVINDDEFEALNAEKEQPDPGEDIVQDLNTDEETASWPTRLDEIENKLDSIVARLDAGSSDNEPELRHEAGEQPLEIEDTVKETTETLASLDNDQVAEIGKEIADLVLKKLGTIVEKRIKYHLGIID